MLAEKVLIMSATKNRQSSEPFEEEDEPTFAMRVIPDDLQAAAILVTDDVYVMQEQVNHAYADDDDDGVQGDKEVWCSICNS